jgi:hypothetical protein
MYQPTIQEEGDKNALKRRKTVCQRMEVVRTWEKEAGSSNYVMNRRLRSQSLLASITRTASTSTEVAFTLAILSQATRISVRYAKDARHNPLRLVSSVAPIATN